MDAPSPVTIADAKTLSCGLIMPLAEFDNCSATHWEDVRSIIVGAVEAPSEPQFRARMVSDGDETGIIHRRIIQNVYSDPIAICDVSGRNPNVLFELGMRLAFDKPVVIVKDDKTPFMFDTGMIEHLAYPRDLRHGTIEIFKSQLARKVSSTYAASISSPDTVSFIKSFGPFKTVALEEVKEPVDKAILSLLSEMQGQINRLANSMTNERTVVTPTRAPTMVAPINKMTKEIYDEMKVALKEQRMRGASHREAIAAVTEQFKTIEDFVGESEFARFIRRAAVEIADENSARQR